MSRSRVSRIDLPLSRLSSTRGIYLRRARLGDPGEPCRGRGVEHVEQLGALRRGPTPTNEHTEFTAVPGDPLARLLVAFRCGPVSHRLEDFGDGRHTMGWRWAAE